MHFPMKIKKVEADENPKQDYWRQGRESEIIVLLRFA